MRAAWNATILREFIGDDDVALQNLLNDYLLAIDQTRTDLQAAIDIDDTGAVIELAHKFKSSSRWVGALALGEWCVQLETLGSRGDMQAVRDLQEPFERELEAVRVDIHAVLRELG